MSIHIQVICAVGLKSSKELNLFVRSGTLRKHGCLYVIVNRGGVAIFKGFLPDMVTNNVLVSPKIKTK